MTDVPVFLDLLRKVNNLVTDARAEHAEFGGKIVMSADEATLTISIAVESPELLPKKKKPTYDEPSKPE